MESPAKSLNDILNPDTLKSLQPIQEAENIATDIADISGVPEEHQFGRHVRIFMPARTATQSGWNNVGIWKIELDTRERWDNPCIGYSSGYLSSFINKLKDLYCRILTDLALTTYYSEFLLQL